MAITKDSFLRLLCAVCLFGTVMNQDMAYEEMIAQIQACPRECRCPSNFPRAVYCDNKGLKSIPRIPPFTWYLYLQNNQIQVVSADALRNATQLRWVNLSRNKITSEGVEKGTLDAMTRLEHLYMDDNLLSWVPFPLPASLEHLSLSRNRISKIPDGVFFGLDKLTLLDLQGNKLMDDAVTEVSLKGLNNLVQINLAKNQLSNMPLGLPPTTTQLFLDGNNIDKIPTGYFKGLPKMAFLRLNHNKLGSSGVPNNVFNISSILDLQLSHNLLTEVPLIPPGLEQLYLDHNNIKSVSGSNVCPVDIEAADANDSAPRLRYLRLDGNDIEPPIPRDVILCFRLLRSIVI
ncbi:keratocan [Corythoichthys intestinalis]|uniref:keratocan n=1 Tax=Corythoichthys intestinalis TaxID=161448 RepID=UPI0025A4E782|nr:keratocan [Corythoichthys intestinalis]XP_061809083.1 keratocan-like [Nerophis lumbriciformis]